MVVRNTVLLDRDPDISARQRVVLLVKADQRAPRDEGIEALTECVAPTRRERELQLQVAQRDRFPDPLREPVE